VAFIVSSEKVAGIRHRGLSQIGEKYTTRIYDENNALLISLHYTLQF